jgi:hypothetical protein
VSEPPDVYDVALRVARALEELGIDYALGGSLASSLQGEPRATNDIDFAARLEERHVAPLAQRLGSDFVIDEEGLRDAIRRKMSHNIFFLPTVLKVDLFMRGGEPFDESELARRKRVTVREGQAVFVASPEDNLLRKLAWFRMGGEVSDLQWRDVLGILRISGPELDRPYLALWAQQLDVADLLARALAQA